MKDSIDLDELLNYSDIEYDFRRYANPNDELAYLFDQWVPYYDLKYRICKALKPKSILEIGVRFGYSANAFLSASPGAKYVGIDNNSNSFGGEKGAINWAQKINENYNCQFILTDSQKLRVFPGEERYDLIHIDGQQDGDGTYHDLELGLQKGKWLLVDGYHWSKENMLSSTFFIEKYRKFIEYSIIIPGYAGELLIKVKNNFNINNKSYKSLENEYNRDYYVKDCGGFESFLKTKGKKVDGRLKELLNIVNPQKGEKILDIGCGRGELAYAINQKGATCIGVDYSNDAIKIAKETFGDYSEEGLQFIHTDITELGAEYSSYFDKIVLADVYEHIEEEVMHRILDKIKTLLNDEGLIFIHTAPNLNYYDSVYNSNRKIAKKAGLYLPKNPRTIYEDMMHINEQKPEILEKSLKKHFKHVKVWCNCAKGLLEEDQNDKNLYNEIFAISCKLDRIDTHIKNMCYVALDPFDINVEIAIDRTSSDLMKFKDVLDVKIQNNTKQVLATKEPYPVHISYHILNNEKEAVLFDGERTDLPVDLQSGDLLKMQMRISKHGLEKGVYTYRICLVQEFQFWFENSYTDVLIEI